MSFVTPSSPPLTPPGSNTTNSRKRQRSLSMDTTASSSSPKRSASEGPMPESSLRSTASPPSQSTMVTEDEIDSYMKEQGEEDGSIPLQNTSGNLPADPQEKFEWVERLRKEPMSPGETWYIVSSSWFKRWTKACTGQVDKDGPIEEKDVGPVDNADLLAHRTKDQVSLDALEGETMEFAPETVWNAFVQWYGQPDHPLPRQVYTRGESQKAYLEVHPPRMRAIRVVRSLTSAPDPRDVTVTVSCHDSLNIFCRKLATAFVDPPDCEYRVWAFRGSDFKPTGAAFLAQEVPKHDTYVVKPDTQTVEEKQFTPTDLFLVEFQEDGKWLVEEKTDTLALAPAPLFSAENGFFSKLETKSSPPKSNVNASLTTTSSTSSVFKPSIASPIRAKPAVAPGTCGLGNLGNTCFMNSALQCLTHTKELAEYFQMGVFEEELNTDNPLGMGGAIAQVFGALLHRIWSPDSTSGTAYQPRDFKQTLSRFAPQFSGYAQHDSQEFLAFLLDGLHEDLNRIHKKPYIEKPDWVDGGGDKELAELAQTSWEGYLKRNDSVIVDLFQGQYESRVVCPECEKESITFDPYMYLTLPLPVKKKWQHAIHYVPWDLQKQHVKVPIQLPRESSFKDVRQLLGRWLDVPAENLLTAEIFNHRFYKSLDDNCLVGDVADNDILVCFELPCHARQSRSYQPQPLDPFIVPVFLCDDSPPRGSYGYKNPNLFGYPFITVVDQEQARDLEAIYGNVMDRLSRWTRNARDLYTWEAGTSGGIEEVPVVTDPGSSDWTRQTESVTEIKENGDVVTFEQAIPQEEGDIVDEKGLVIQEDVPMQDVSDADVEPRKVGPKKGVFNFRLQINQKEFGTAHSSYGANAPRYEPWDARLKPGEEGGSPPVLLEDGDAFYCEFDENVKAYYFGEHELFEVWEEFIHPEYAEAIKAELQKKRKGISLQDCLEEFTKEEKLGEDDLWYCPRCKKHQQATKNFNIWSVPDYLVVHLKRFSNSRILRDKIDAFVDFPVEGLDLSDMVGERQVAERLIEQGIDVQGLGLHNVDEPLVYDLYAVDEHLGGLGGGHYRAYAYNHVTEQWYHFDDSYVTPAQPADSVNANAYLLFYKRRTNRPLGGKSHLKIEEARQKKEIDGGANGDMINTDTQLPTPPNEPSAFGSYGFSTGSGVFSSLKNLVSAPRASATTSRSSPPPPLTDADPPSFEDAQYDPLVLPQNTQPSPTSSNEAEADDEPDTARWANEPPYSSELDNVDEETGISPSRSPSLLASAENSSISSETSPDTHSIPDQAEVHDNTLTDLKEIPIPESTLHDIDL